MRKLADDFDHAVIYEKGTLKENTIKAFHEENFRLIAVPFRPTAECFAKYFFELLSEEGISLKSVTVYETPKTALFMRKIDMEKKYKVAEIFTSINGEGSRAGELAVFIRLCGCNLRCSYCDTMWANSEIVPHREMSAEEIRNAVLKTSVKNITLTGGEPLAAPYVKELLDCLAEEKHLSIEIETNGSMSIREFSTVKNRPIFTIDYKLPIKRYGR